MENMKIWKDDHLYQRRYGLQKTSGFRVLLQVLWRWLRMNRSLQRGSVMKVSVVEAKGSFAENTALAGASLIFPGSLSK